MGDVPFLLPAGYDHVRALGSGAYGDVVLARHTALGREVAIKRILPRHLGDPSALDRFRREAQTLASTSCPSVVKVYDLIRDHGTAYLVMEFVRGTTLGELVEGGPVPADVALPILTDVAEALAATAELGIVHRDVKPDNVFVLDDGSAKLGDFGLARMLNDPSVFRTEGASDRGTPAYFPPEISQGFNEPDPRSDAYSFAVMAYQTLTGSLPFDAPTPVAMMIAHWDREPIPPAERLPGFPQPAAAALSGGLAKDPTVRIMPTDLVAQLASVPAKSWPVVAQSAPPARRAAAPRAAPAVRLNRPSPWRRAAPFVVPILIVAAVILAEALLSR